MPPVPELPEAPYPLEQDTSMLSRKFGREIINYFSSSPLNRVSFLRTDHAFLSAALRHPTSSFLLFNNLAPLAKDPAQLAYASYTDVRPLIGEDPYSKPEAELIKEFNSTVTIPQLIFLGIDEKQSEKGLQWNDYRGAPFFALDVTPKGTIEKACTALIEDMKSNGLTFIEGRMHTSLSAGEAAIYAQARSLLDWNARNPFCAQCGHPTLSINAGTKRTCPPTDLASVATPLAASSAPAAAAADPVPSQQRPPCATRKGVSNISFPRTDPTIIVAVLSADGSRVLLGRARRYPPYWYSTLAGFVEPAESIEDATRREVWEEAGVRVGRVVIHSTQPWPYPANLMIGALAQALPGGEEISLQHDPELEDAKWVGVDEISHALEFGTSGLGEEPSKEYKPGSLRLPPPTAIANQLLRAALDGYMLKAGTGEHKI
ncbi:hypothetical protein L228DRAFT_232935 [Xylona heveae TC161]|uniref:NAD(+) diphosphatase n=1 Tax=Xylona heveae (strain CBS 132557 / TC161) TaxID=1328760 RepID=A0A165AEL6_XYLHT|nr:hypothetical protein L228DRAFT_232935 [Xylona heveae TC161]KZF20350.1 hypothetical protein L228DRAFT_232935 [Xylona heveae TC161]